MRNLVLVKPVVNVMLIAKLVAMHILAAYEMMKAFPGKQRVRHCYPRPEMLHQKDQRKHKNVCSRRGCSRGRTDLACEPGYDHVGRISAKAGLFSFSTWAQALKTCTPVTGPERTGDSREANEDSLFRWLKVKCVKVFTGLTAPLRLDFLSLTRAPTTGSDFSPLISLNLGLHNGNLMYK